MSTAKFKLSVTKQLVKNSNPVISPTNIDTEMILLPIQFFTILSVSWE